jgi:hypothetical protein
MSLPDIFAPKSRPPRQLHSVPIGIPAFLRRNVMNDMPTTAPQNLDELERDMAAEIARRQHTPVRALSTGPIDPIIGGLLKHLPEPGEVWSEDDRKLWLELLNGTFKLIYRSAS